MRTGTSRLVASLIAPLLIVFGCEQEDDPSPGALAIARAEDSVSAEAVLDEILFNFSSDAFVFPESTAAGFTRSEEWLLPILESEKVVDTRLALSAERGFEITEGQSGLSVHVRPAGVFQVPYSAYDGYLVYEDAYGPDSPLVFRPHSDGVEDFVVLPSRTRDSLRYNIELSEDVAGLRLVAGTLEVLDATGTPRIRMAPPYSIDAAHVRRNLDVAVEGCEVDGDPRAPWGRTTVDPGARECAIVISWDDDAEYPLLIDPSWTSANSMATARAFHGAETLSTGNVLVFGGSGSTVLSSAELWNPGTNTWAAANSMIDSRTQFGWTSISNGGVTYVLVAGGGGSCGIGACDETELYNPGTGTWSVGGTMISSRRNFPLVSLKDGTNRAFASGGLNSAATVLSTAETYNPATNTWTAAAGALATARYDHKAVALSAINSSRVIMAGGLASGGTILATAERFLPSSGTISTAGNMGNARTAFTLSLLAADHVLAAAGQYSSAGLCRPRSDRYNPTTNSWSSTGSVPIASLCYHSGVTLASGLVMIAGGRTSQSSASLANAFLYDPVAGTWTATSSLATVRADFPVAQYPASPAARVLAAGGLTGGSTRTALAEFYTP